MRPTAAESGEEALALLEHASQASASFALVLIDAMMPEMDGFMLAQAIQAHPALPGATIMMLSSGGQINDAARCRELGITRYLIKPIALSELRQVILMALEGRVISATPAASEPHPIRRTSQRPLHVLLAEDDVVNQHLAVWLLEKWGHTVVVANNGREALAMCEGGSFDLVLMDVHMPEMGGLEVTAAIREGEKITDGHLPIIAMTARAMREDRE